MEHISQRIVCQGWGSSMRTVWAQRQPRELARSAAIGSDPSTILRVMVRYSNHEARARRELTTIHSAGDSAPVIRYKTCLPRKTRRSRSFFNLTLLCVLRTLRGDILSHYDPVAKSFSPHFWTGLSRLVVRLQESPGTITSEPRRDGALGVPRPDAPATQTPHPP